MIRQQKHLPTRRTDSTDEMSDGQYFYCVKFVQTTVTYKF